MARLFVFFLALIVGCTTYEAPPANHPTGAERAADLVRKTAALVSVDEELTPWIHCAAVWVGPDTLLTAEHCSHIQEVDDAALYQVQGNNEVYFGIVAKRDHDHDLALIKAFGKQPSHGVATVALERIKQGDSIQIMGHTLGFGWTYSTGEIAAIRTAYDMPWLQTLAPAWKGNSGGGAFTPAGDLVGIASFVITNGPWHTTFFAPQSTIEAFLRP